MPRMKKVKPEDCPGHEWVELRTVKICERCTASEQKTEGLTPEEIKEIREHQARAATRDKARASKIAANIPDFTKLPPGITALLPPGSGDLLTYSVCFLQDIMPPEDFKRDLKKARLEWAGKRDFKFYRAAQVFFASTIVGADIDRVAEYLGLPWSWVNKIGQRYIANGIWRDGKIRTEHVGHDPDDSPEVEMESVLIVMCGMGDIARGNFDSHKNKDGRLIRRKGK